VTQPAPRRRTRRADLTTPLVAALVPWAALALAGALAYGVSRWYAASRGPASAAGRPRRRCPSPCSPFHERVRRSARSIPSHEPQRGARDGSGRGLAYPHHPVGTPARSASRSADRPNDEPVAVRPGPHRDFASAQTILCGQYVKFGDEIRIDPTLQTWPQQKTTPLKATAASQAALLSAVAQSAASVQQTLAAGSADVLNELKASAWRPSTQSFEALRLYNNG